MRLPVKLLASLGVMTLLLSGCGKDFGQGFGETEGWGGYTKGWGDVDEGMDNSVGLCSYTGGCMPQKSDNAVGANSYKGTKDSSGAQAGDSSQ